MPTYTVTFAYDTTADDPTDAAQMALAAIVEGHDPAAKPGFLWFEVEDGDTGETFDVEIPRHE